MKVNRGQHFPELVIWIISFSANPTKLSNTLKVSVFDHFVGSALKTNTLNEPPGLIATNKLIRKLKLTKELTAIILSLI